MSLHTTTYGDHGSRVVFCHGLFGQGKNWTRIGKVLSPDHRVLLVDMPHHGRSAWADEFDYLDEYFPEFRPYIGQCQFTDCRHLTEPGCAILAALSEGHIHPDRYATYHDLLVGGEE